MLTINDIKPFTIISTEKGTHFKIKAILGDTVTSAAYPYNKASERDEPINDFLQFLNERNSFVIIQ